MTAGPRAAANRGAGVKHDPYPCYRDSGVAWLGEVPEHWEVKRLGIALVDIGRRRNTQHERKEEYWADIED